jgi:hypothetical protein
MLLASVLQNLPLGVGVYARLDRLPSRQPALGQIALAAGIAPTGAGGKARKAT